VRIVVDLSDGNKSRGTAFFFRIHEKDGAHIPLVVTNKHVLQDGVTATFRLRKQNSDGSPNDVDHVDFHLDDLSNRFVQHPDPTVDLAAMPMAPLLNQAKENNIEVFYRQLGSKNMLTASSEADLTAVEDILMVGYPNGIWDETNNLPIMRRGVTATHPAKDYEGRSEFMIDAACFPGSSGSPVMLYSSGGYMNKSGGAVLGGRLNLLGVLYAGPQHMAQGEIKIVTIPTRDVPIAVSMIPNNLGNVIKAKMLLDFEKVIK